MFGVIGKAVVLGSVLEVREYLGCAIVFSAVVLAQLDFGKKAKPADGDEPLSSEPEEFADENEKNAVDT